MKELEFLKNLATNCSILDPASIFWSPSRLEICIRAIVQGKERATDDFLSKLYDYLKKLEIENHKKDTGISSSRNMEEGQPVRILIPGTGVYRCEVISGGGPYLMVSRPVNKNTSSPPWPGLSVSIYFWRDNDAGYVFDTTIVDDVFFKGYPALKADHSDKLFRTQKRKSLRTKLRNKPAFLYLAGIDDRPDKIEKQPGLKCFLENVSDTGCAVRVGGQANAGRRFKVQFVLNNTPVCMIGTARSAEFSKDTNTSLIHIQAEPLPASTRNIILGEIFGMRAEDDDDELPPRVSEQTAGGADKSAAKSRDTTPQFQEVTNE
jgi:c-di-GMP-binding flagellar brake protein YcgR